MVLMGIAFVVGFWLFSLSNNSDNIKNYIESRGGELLTQEWEPFGKTWFRKNDETFYKIKYRDEKGNIHESLAKTSLFSSVYLSQDRIIEHNEEDLVIKLKVENAFLKAEIAKLKGVDYYQKPLEENLSVENDEIETTPPIKISTFRTEDGNFSIRQKNRDIELGDKVLLDGKPAADGRYKLGTLHYISVKNGRVS